MLLNACCVLRHLMYPTWEKLLSKAIAKLNSLRTAKDKSQELASLKIKLDEEVQSLKD